jgi:hypothetical protein
MKANEGRRSRFPQRGWIVLCAMALAVSWLGCDGAGDDGWGGYDDRGYADNHKYSGRQDRGRGTGNYQVEVVEKEPDYGDSTNSTPNYHVDYEDGGGPGEPGAPAKYEWKYTLDYQDLILSPDGANLLMMVPKPGPALGFETPGLVLVVQPLPDGIPVCFPQVQDVARINFSADGRLAFLLDDSGTRLQILHLDDYTVSDVFFLGHPFTVVDVSPNGRYAVLTNLPIGDKAEVDFSEVKGCKPPASFNLPPNASLCEAGFVDLVTGEQWIVPFGRPLRDLDFCPLTFDAIFSYSFQYFGPTSPNKTHFLFYETDERKFTNKLIFPNCSDEVVISETSQHALLGPVICQVWKQEPIEAEEPEEQGEWVWEWDDGYWEEVQVQVPGGGEQEFQDPISVIRLDTRKFVTNLPGFGPVAVSEKRTMAIGFTNREAMENEWGYFDQWTPFGLIFVDLKTLGWNVIDWGDDVPAYTVSPDGNYLFAYDDTLEDEVASSPLRRINLETLVMEPVYGPQVELDAYAWQPGTSNIYLLHDKGLFMIPDSSTQVVALDVPLQPELINIRPQGDFLLLGVKDAPTFYALPLETTGPTAPELVTDFQLTL